MEGNFYLNRVGEMRIYKGPILQTVENTFAWGTICSTDVLSHSERSPCCAENISLKLTPLDCMKKNEDLTYCHGPAFYSGFGFCYVF